MLNFNPKFIQMRIIKKLLIALLIVFVIAQFFQPEKNQGDMASVTPFIEYSNPPQDVKLILEQHCYDCHSDVTQYPWYGSITPVNYWMAEHVEHGKEHFDLSSWDGYSLKQKDHKVEELIEMVEKKEMPLASYTYAHWDAKLSDDQINSVVEWAKSLRVKLGMEEGPQ